MGCIQSKEDAVVVGGLDKEREVANIKKPVWKADGQMTRAELQRKREEFWVTQPHYGGSKEIWDALRAACSLDPVMAKAVLEAAEVKVMRPDMSVSYDPRGFRYELPQYVLADPVNLAG